MNEVVQNNQNVNSSNQGESKFNGLAIASFVVSIVGLFIFGVLLGLIGISMGMTALKRIKIFPNEKGKGLAIAGIVIGIIDVVIMLIAFLGLMSILGLALMS